MFDIGEGSTFDERGSDSWHREELVVVRDVPETFKSFQLVDWQSIDSL